MCTDFPPKFRLDIMTSFSVFTSIFFQLVISAIDGFIISLQEVAAKYKMSIFRQKLFRWKEKEKIPKTEWPELVGKVRWWKRPLGNQ